MEAILLALLASYGLPALAAGVTIFGIWTVHIKYLLPERTRRREREDLRDERLVKLLETNNTVSAGLQRSIGDLSLSIGELRLEFTRLSADIDDVKGDVKELKGAINAGRR